MKKEYVLVMSILLFVSGLCSAVTPVNIDDFTGTSWVVYGKSSVRSSIVGGSAEGIGYVDFDSYGSVGISDETGTTMYGTYGVDSKGKLFVNVTADDVQNFFDDYLGRYSDYVTVTATGAKSTCKVTYSGSTVSLAITISAKARIDVSYEDEDGDTKEYHGSISFKLSMTGDHPVADGVPKWASKWDINANASLKAKKIKVSMPVPIELSLGDANSGLGLNQYKFVNTDGVLFSSAMQHDFCRQKGKILFGGDDGDEEITSIIDELVTANSDIPFDYLDVVGSITATVKSGKADTITLKGTFKFEATNYDEDKDKFIVINRGTLTLTGTGVPSP